MALLSLLEKLVSENKIRILIDINRKIETSQRKNGKRRKKLTNLMFKLSKGYFVLPFLVLEEYEIRNYFYRKMRLKEDDIKELAISKDPGHLMVGTPMFVGSSNDKEKLKKAEEGIGVVITINFIVGMVRKKL